jgi:hypothetical protein
MWSWLIWVKLVVRGDIASGVKEKGWGERGAREEFFSTGPIYVTYENKPVPVGVFLYELYGQSQKHTDDTDGADLCDVRK